MREDLKSAEHQIKIHNYPNPFNSSTIINFKLKNNSSQNNLAIYNLKGELIEELYSGSLTKGEHNFNWQTKSNLATGVYIVKLQTESSSYTRKLLYAK